MGVSLRGGAEDTLPLNWTISGWAVGDPAHYPPQRNMVGGDEHDYCIRRTRLSSSYVSGAKLAFGNQRLK